MFTRQKAGECFRESRTHTQTLETKALETRKSAHTGFALRAVKMFSLESRCPKPPAINQMCSREVERKQQSR